MTKATRKVCHQCHCVLTRDNLMGFLKGKLYCVRCMPMESKNGMCLECETEKADEGAPLCTSLNAMI